MYAYVIGVVLNLHQYNTTYGSEIHTITMKKYIHLYDPFPKTIFPSYKPISQIEMRKRDLLSPSHIYFTKTNEM